MPYVRRAANHTRVGLFDGYLAVASRDEAALMEAVWRFGPVAVSINAGGPHAWMHPLTRSKDITECCGYCTAIAYSSSSARQPPSNADAWGYMPHVHLRLTPEPVRGWGRGPAAHPPTHNQHLRTQLTRAPYTAAYCQSLHTIALVLCPRT